MVLFLTLTNNNPIWTRGLFNFVINCYLSTLRVPFLRNPLCIELFVGNSVNHGTSTILILMLEMLCSGSGTCGGLLSLFLGFSVISLIEAVYGFLLRPLSRVLHRVLSRPKHDPPAPRHKVIVVAPVPSKQHPHWILQANIFITETYEYSPHTYNNNGNVCIVVSFPQSPTLILDFIILESK